MKIKRPPLQLAFIAKRRAEKNHHREESNRYRGSSDIFEEPYSIWEFTISQRKKNRKRSKSTEQIGQKGEKPQSATAFGKGPIALFIPKTDNCAEKCT